MGDFRMDRNNCKVQLELTLKDARQFAPVILPAEVFAVHSVAPPVGAPARPTSESSFPSFRDGPRPLSPQASRWSWRASPQTSLASPNRTRKTPRLAVLLQCRRRLKENCAEDS